jgi:hypothetical protein
MTDQMFWPLTAVTMVVTGHVFMLWRAVEERTYRSRMYALRDDLRWAAIKDDRLSRSPLFDHFDKRLTCSAVMVRMLSPYLALPFLFRRDLRHMVLRSAEQDARAVSVSGIESLQRINARIGEEIYRFFWRRSPLAMCALAVGLFVFSTGHRSLRAVAAAFTMAAIEIRTDG